MPPPSTPARILVPVWPAQKRRSMKPLPPVMLQASVNCLWIVPADPTISISVSVIWALRPRNRWVLHWVLAAPVSISWRRMPMPLPMFLELRGVTTNMPSWRWRIRSSPSTAPTTAASNTCMWMPSPARLWSEAIKPVPRRQEPPNPMRITSWNFPVPKENVSRARVKLYLILRSYGFKWSWFSYYWRYG